MTDSTHNAIAIGFAADQGEGPAMEDAVSVTQLPPAPGTALDAGATLCLVADGECGAGAARNLEQNLPGLVERQLRGQALASADYEGALRAALQEAERTILHEEAASGATVCAALLVAGNLVVANVGDCRAVLLSGDVAVDGQGPNSKLSAGARVSRLSVEHRPSSNPEEAARLEAAGVSFDRDSGRLLNTDGVDTLRHSRALGHRSLKAANSAEAGTAAALPPGALIPEPHVISHVLAAEDRVLVLASDGVFDVMCDMEVAAFVAGRLQKRTLTPTSIAKQLLIEAQFRQRRSDEGGDNASAVVAVLGEATSLVVLPGGTSSTSTALGGEAAAASGGQMGNSGVEPAVLSAAAAGALQPTTGRAGGYLPPHLRNKQQTL